MPNKAELVKLTDLSNRGKISLNEAEGYLAKKGWKEQERNEALKYMDTVKKEHVKKHPNSNKKSGILLKILILLILFVASVYLLSFYGIIDLSKFMIY